MSDLFIGVDFSPWDADQRRMVLLENEGVPGIAVLGHSQFRHHSSVAQKHTHAGCLEVVLCQRGALVFENNGTRHELMPGDLLLNRPHEMHRLLTYPKGLALYWILIRVEPLTAPLLMLPVKERVALRRALLQLSPQVRMDGGSVRKAFTRLFEVLNAPKNELARLNLNGSVLLLLLNILETTQYSKAQPTTERLLKVIEMLSNAPEVDYRIDDLAHQAALSPSRFIECFKQITGVPPRHFLLDCRLTKAKKQLTDTPESVTQIALSLGFNSSQHFASTFKRATGLTPSQWRQTQ